MAQHITIFAYGEATTYDKLNGGWQGFSYAQGQVKSIPVQGTVFTAISPAQTVGLFSGMNSIVEVLPNGLQVHGKKYFCDATASTLTTAANA